MTPNDTCPLSRLPLRVLIVNFGPRLLAGGARRNSFAKSEFTVSFVNFTFQRRLWTENLTCRRVMRLRVLFVNFATRQRVWNLLPSRWVKREFTVLFVNFGPAQKFGRTRPMHPFPSGHNRPRRACAGVSGKTDFEGID